MKTRQLTAQPIVTTDVRAALLRWAVYALLLLLPLSASWPLGAPLSQHVPAFFVTPELYPVDIAAGVIILLALLLRGERRVVLGPPGVTIPLLGLCALGLASIPLALNQQLAAYSALRWLLAAGLYLALLQADLPIERAAGSFIAGLGVQTLVGLGQALVQGPLGLPGEAALNVSQSGAAIIAVGQQRWLRAYGLTFHPNVLGGYLACGLLISLPLVRRLSVRLLWWLLWIGLLVSFSRSAWLAIAVLLPALAWLLARRQPALRRALASTLLGAALVLLGCLLLLSSQFRTRFSPTSVGAEYRSLSERKALIDVALGVIAERPLTGIGAGNFPLAVYAARSSAIPQPAHNVPLLLASELGLLGGLLWLWIWLSLALGLERMPFDASSVTLIGAWFVLGSIGLWDGYPWALNTGRLLSVTLLALSCSALRASLANQAGWPTLAAMTGSASLAAEQQRQHPKETDHGSSS